MSERDEYLQDIAKAKKELAEAEKEVETLKAKAKSQMAYFSTLLNRASSYVGDPTSLNDIKDIYRTISALQDIHGEETYDKLMDTLKEIDDLIRKGDSRTHPGKIDLLKDDIETLEEELKYLDKKAMASQLDEIASDLESQGEPVIAYAIDKVADFLEKKS